MKKILLTTATLALLFAACDKSKDNPNNPDTSTVVVTGVTLNKSADTLAVGDTLRLIAIVEPDNATNKAIHWSIDKPLVAVIADDGTVIAWTAGTANITVTTTDGNKTATCVITIIGFSFKTDTTWTIPNGGTWSDVVMSTRCRKTSFNGNTADCRQNEGNYGDLFSWYAVDAWKNELCPAPWRVPTKDDFVNLDKALDGTGKNEQYNTTLRDKYLNSWGGAYGGYCDSDGTLYSQGSIARYWSQSEYSSGRAYSLRFDTSGYVDPQDYNNKYHGFTLRCVR
jgi:uncharacterized protein (TIGR02145 family)